MRPDEVLTLIEWMGGLWPGWRPNAATVPAFADVLGDLDARTVTTALRVFAREDHEWPPSAGKLRAYAVQLEGRDAALPTADAAWQEFYKAWKARDQFAPPPSSDEWSTPLIAVAAERIPSWHALRGMSSEDFRWIGRDFRAAYQEALERRRFDATADAVKDLPLPEGIAALLGETR